MSKKPKQIDEGQVTDTGAIGGEEVAQAPELTVQDLGNLRAIIDVASQRGAFRAAEMEAVGNAFNKLNNFLNAVAPPAEQSNEEAPAE
jgi:hypothetical protein